MDAARASELNSEMQAIEKQSLEKAKSFVGEDVFVNLSKSQQELLTYLVDDGSYVNAEDVAFCMNTTVSGIARIARSLKSKNIAYYSSLLGKKQVWLVQKNTHS